MTDLERLRAIGMPNINLAVFGADGNYLSTFWSGMTHKYLVLESKDVSPDAENFEEAQQASYIGKISQAQSPDQAIEKYMSEYYGSEPTLTEPIIITAIQLPDHLDTDPQVVQCAERSFIP
jgi:hypothetical protein